MSLSESGAASLQTTGLSVVFSHTTELKKIFASIALMFDRILLIFDKEGLKIRKMDNDAQMLLLLSIEANIKTAEEIPQLLPPSQQLFLKYELGSSATKKQQQQQQNNDDNSAAASADKTRWTLGFKTHDLCTMFNNAAKSKKNLSLQANDHTKALFDINGMQFTINLLDMDDREMNPEMKYNNLIEVASDVLLEKIGQIASVSKTLRIETLEDDVVLHEGDISPNNTTARASLKEINQLYQQECIDQLTQNSAPPRVGVIVDEAAIDKNKVENELPKPARKKRKTRKNAHQIVIEETLATSNNNNNNMIDSSSQPTSNGGTTTIPSIVTIVQDQRWLSGLNCRFLISPIQKFLKGAIVADKVCMVLSENTPEKLSPLFLQYHLHHFGNVALILSQDISQQEEESDKKKSSTTKNSSTTSNTNDILVENTAIKPIIPNAAKNERKRKRNTTVSATNPTTTMKS